MRTCATAGRSPCKKKRVPHPSHLTGSLTRVELTKIQKHQTRIWLKGNKPTLSTQSLHTLIRSGMHFRRTQMSGSLKWTSKQIVAIGEDFHSQVGDDTVKTTLYKVRCQENEKNGRYVGVYHSSVTRPWKDPGKYIEDHHQYHIADL